MKLFLDEFNELGVLIYLNLFRFSGGLDIQTSQFTSDRASA